MCFTIYRVKVDFLFNFLLNQPLNIYRFTFRIELLKCTFLRKAAKT